MQVILMQKVRNLGDLGETADVRPGYGRNYLIPRGIALPATKANMKMFQNRRAELQAASEDRRQQAELRAQQLRGREFVIAARASDEGKLYGSVGPQDIAAKISAANVPVGAREVVLTEGNIRITGEYSAQLELHPDVEAEVTIIVAQQTAMGINMPNRGAAAEDEAGDEATADEVAGERVADAGEPADASATEADPPIGERDTP